jgi:hypothetical protein
MHANDWVNPPREHISFWVRADSNCTYVHTCTWTWLTRMQELDMSAHGHSTHRNMPKPKSRGLAGGLAPERRRHRVASSIYLSLPIFLLLLWHWSSRAAPERSWALRTPEQHRCTPAHAPVAAAFSRTGVAGTFSYPISSLWTRPKAHPKPRCQPAKTAHQPFLTVWLIPRPGPPWAALDALSASAWIRFTVACSRIHHEPHSHITVNQTPR